MGGMSLPLARPSSLAWPEDRIEQFCHRWKVAELALFGSAARGELRPDSDVDLLVTFAPEAGWSLLDHARMERELAEILGREVDLVTRPAIERSANWIRRKDILGTARTVFRA